MDPISNRSKRFFNFVPINSFYGKRINGQRHQNSFKNSKWNVAMAIEILLKVVHNINAVSKGRLQIVQPLLHKLYPWYFALESQLTFTKKIWYNVLVKAAVIYKSNFVLGTFSARCFVLSIVCFKKALQSKWTWRTIVGRDYSHLRFDRSIKQ